MEGKERKLNKKTTEMRGIKERKGHRISKEKNTRNGRKSKGREENKNIFEDT